MPIEMKCSIKKLIEFVFEKVCDINLVAIQHVRLYISNVKHLIVNVVFKLKQMPIENNNRLRFTYNSCLKLIDAIVVHHASSKHTIESELMTLYCIKKVFIQASAEPVLI